MAYEELKALRAEDFMGADPVLCYGAGGAFQSVASYMIGCGIRIAGVIDANKTGSVTIKENEISILTMREAIQRYGTDAIVIITIASQPVFQQVKQDLVQHGYDGQKIFDLNVWTWLTVPSEKSCCEYLTEYLNLFSDALVKCCLGGVKEPFFCEWFMEGRPIQESIDCFFEKSLYYIEESKQGRIPLYCRDCDLLTKDSLMRRRLFGISDNTYCNADCVYCGCGCSAPRVRSVTTSEERFDAILCTLEKLSREDRLDKRDVVTFAAGEITINPYRERIYETLKRVLDHAPELELRICSNCFLYDQKVADLLAQGKASFLMCDLDAGTPENYIKVKGFNKFAVVRENLKRYAQFGTVKLKYIVMPGWNDTPADFEGTVRLLKELGSTELLLSLENSVSKEGSRVQVREALYAAARLMALLEQNGIRAVLPSQYWKKEYIPILQRLCREIQSMNI